MNSSFIRIEKLSHKYSNNWAIRDINIEIDKTGIYGLLGSNGAGKSTTMNILCGVLKQTSGDVYIGGINLLKQPIAAKKQLGFLPQQAPLYLDLTVKEYLEYCAQLRLMDTRSIPKAIQEVSIKTGIQHFSNRLIKNLSGGYRQRLGIAQAIIHKPKIVVLDEPTNGLDPNQITEVRKLIREISEDRVVLISSHILSEIQLLCNDILMIESGQLVFSDSMDAFNNYIAPQSIIVSFDQIPAVDHIMRINGITRTEILGQKSLRIYFEGDDSITERIMEAGMQNKWRIKEISVEKGSVDEIFKHLSQKASINN